ncbi:hypothetical protein JW948_11795 [bacterium]|nr:hypothetical protein [bacterium]
MHLNKMIIFIALTASLAKAVTDGAHIHQIKGDVRVRRGMEEVWSPAGAGMELKAMDTVFSGEASEVVLVLDDQTRFVLGSNAVLDISDLRRITERQLFLYLMSQKVGRLPDSDDSQKIHIANVSVVRGSRVGTDSGQEATDRSRDWKQEVNGAKALFQADFHTNAIMKFYRILERYPGIEDRGEIHFYIGRSFERLEETGRAYDAYQDALERIDENDTAPEVSQRRSRIQDALIRLKSDS